MKYIQVNENLYLIKLDQKLEGFRDFISSWLYMDESASFLVDPGPLCSIDILKSALDELGVKKLDYVLLTHIHIDHAGGTGKLVSYFPDVKVLCHPKGIPHMADPEKLWKGSLSVLGDTARAYGEIVPVPEKNLFYSETIEAGDNKIEVINTPGHAAHHFSFLMEKTLFAGELGGVNVPLPDMIYMRPATPPRFFLEVWHESLSRVIERKPEMICYGHFGHRTDAIRALTSAGDQLDLWTEVVDEELKTGEEDLVERCREKLLSRDGFYANQQYLDDDVRKRESDFLKNSINGIKEYVLSRESNWDGPG